MELFSKLRCKLKSEHCQRLLTLPSGCKRNGRTHGQQLSLATNTIPKSERFSAPEGLQRVVELENLSDGSDALSSVLATPVLIEPAELVVVQAASMRKHKAS